MLRRAVIYCRLSQDRTGAGIVVERQERECRELANQLGWSVVRVFVDNDVSAFRKKPRPDYRALLESLDAGDADAVLVWHVDRLLRSPKELEAYIDLCEPRAIVTRTVRAGELDLATASGRMIARQLGAVARYESEQIAGRTRAGKADAAGRGAWSGGQRMYGYEVVPLAERQPGGSALRVVPVEAEVVRDASQRVLAGESLRSIARALNQAGKGTARGRPWTGSALRKVLLRPTSAGLRASGGEVIGPGSWEALIDEDSWRGLVAILNDPGRRTTDRHTRAYLGSGLYVCGICKGTLTGNTTAGGGGKCRRAAYRCRVADRDNVTHVVRDVEHLDALVTEVIIARLEQPDASEVLVPRPPATAPMHAEAGALRARLDEAARGWAAGVLTQAQLVAATNELRSRLNDVETQIGHAHQVNALDGVVGSQDISAVWDSLSLDRRRSVLDLLAVVNVLPRERRGRLPGGAYFDPSAVEIHWRGKAR